MAERVPFKCPLCSFQRTYSEAALGRKVRCDKCGGKIRIHGGDKFSVVEAPTAFGAEGEPAEPAVTDTYKGEAVDPDADTPVPEMMKTKRANPLPAGGKQYAPAQTCPLCDSEFDSATMAAGRVRCPKCGATFDAKG